jgi:hypothetical protein
MPICMRYRPNRKKSWLSIMILFEIDTRRVRVLDYRCHKDNRISEKELYKWETSNLRTTRTILCL